jgi:hypothetical protein
MKRILLLTFAMAMIALWGGCATDDFGHEDTRPDDSNHTRIMDSGPGDSSSPTPGGY